jgi:hypothetical protein
MHHRYLGFTRSQQFHACILLMFICFIPVLRAQDLHSAGRWSNIRVITLSRSQEFRGSSASMSRSLSFSQASRSFLTFR